MNKKQICLHVVLVIHSCVTWTWRSFTYKQHFSARTMKVDTKKPVFFLVFSLFFFFSLLVSRQSYEQDIASTTEYNCMEREREKEEEEKFDTVLIYFLFF